MEHLKLARADVYQGCVICGHACSQGQTLSNGTSYHQDCYNAKATTLERLDQKIGTLQNEIRLIERQIEEDESFLKSLRRFLWGDEPETPKLRKRISEREQEIQRLSLEREQVTLLLKRIYDYWLTYPPDWEGRRREALRESRFCENCGFVRAVLHVHHKIPMANGGSHLLENLIVLCEKCHSEKHGGKTFRYEDGARPSAFSERLRIIKEAIRNNQIIHFGYRKYEGDKSQRSIKPVELKQVGQSLCVSGYCYLRQDNRTFAIKRMQGIRIVDRPGECRDK